jgi:mRNA interferase MazF
MCVSIHIVDVMVAPITSTIRDIPSEVALGRGDGMPRACAVNLDHIQTVAKGRLGGVIAVLPVSRLGERREALLFAAGF